MNKIISMSVWGNNPRYIIGALRQIELAKEFFPDWKVRIYTEDKTKFLNDDTLEIVQINDNSYGMYWRFYSLFEDENNIVLIRDSDSRITIREQMAVNEWLSSDKKFHTFKDHDAHYEFPIIGCAFGLKGKLSDSLLQKMEEYKKIYPVYLGDQYYLRDIVWPEVKNDSLVHSMKEGWFGETRKKLKNKFDFCGNGYEYNDMPIYPPTLEECKNFNNKNLDISFKYNKGEMIDE